MLLSAAASRPFGWFLNIEVLGLRLFDVRFFKSVAALLVYNFEIEGYEKGEDAEAGEDDEGHGVVVGYEIGTLFLCRDDGGVVLVGGGEDIADEFRDEAQAYVLHPEDETVGTAEHFLVDNLRHAGPQGSGYEGERDAEQYDGGICEKRTLCLRKDKGEDEMATDEQTIETLRAYMKKFYEMQMEKEEKKDEE